MHIFNNMLQYTQCAIETDAFPNYFFIITSLRNKYFPRLYVSLHGSPARLDGFGAKYFYLFKPNKNG